MIKKIKKPYIFVTNKARNRVIEECARYLEVSYPGHAWLNAACAAIRSLAVTSTDRAAP